MRSTVSPFQSRRFLTAMFCAAIWGAAFGVFTPVSAQGTGGAASPPHSFERDRQSILAMAGTFNVRFDMRETVPFIADYEPLDAKTSGGHEVIRVVEDTGRIIKLQHFLVVTGEDDATMVVKHWRQDWTYEPASVLVYAGAGMWILKPVEADKARHAWSQTVWQTDDSPRYGGVGRWDYDNGVARWTSEETLRPLARRDAIRKPPYDRYLGTNRHALTPKGWVHEQDNAKLGTRDGKSVTFVHETVVNTYDRFSDFAVSAADEYWAKTRLYWAEVRRLWDEAILPGQGIAVPEEADTGSVTGARLMTYADDIASGKTTTPDAIKAASSVIASRQAQEGAPNAP